MDDPDGWKATLRRWLSENVADTRTSDEPSGRTYTASFARVWDALVADIRDRRRWDLVHADEELGILTVRCRTFLGFVDDLTIWVALDRNALTRVEARSRSRVGRGDLGTNRRRLEGLFARLDRALGPDARV